MDSSGEVSRVEGFHINSQVEVYVENIFTSNHM